MVQQKEKRSITSKNHYIYYHVYVFEMNQITTFLLTLYFYFKN